jgi:ABC-type Fe3+/spermidine/putrescine transport system ATPase subunit
VGATNLLTGRQIDSANGKASVEVLAGRQIACVVPQGIDDPASVAVSIRPESIRLVPRAGGAAAVGENCLAGRVSAVTFLGASRRVDIISDGASLQVTTAADMPLPADGEVLLIFAPERTVALPGKVSQHEHHGQSINASGST